MNLWSIGSQETKFKVKKMFQVPSRLTFISEHASTILTCLSCFVKQTELNIYQADAISEFLSILFIKN